MILCAGKEFDGHFCAKLLSDLVQKMFRIWPRDIFQWGKKEICSSGKTERGTAKVVNSLSLARSVPSNQPSHLLASQSSGAGKPWKDPWCDIFSKSRWCKDIKWVLLKWHCGIKEESKKNQRRTKEESKKNKKESKKNKKESKKNQRKIRKISKVNGASHISDFNFTYQSW